MSTATQYAEYLALSAQADRLANEVAIFRNMIRRINAHEDMVEEVPEVMAEDLQALLNNYAMRQRFLAAELLQEEG